MAYDDFLDVKLVEGPIASQRAVGAALLLAETQGVAIYCFGDSRVTAPGGAGLDRCSALRLLLPTLTTHRNIPFTEFCPPLPYTSQRSPFMLGNSSGAYTTSLATTEARELPLHDPGNVHAIGLNRAPIFSGGASWFGFDPECRDVSPVVGCRGLTKWDRSKNFRGRVFVCSNPTTTTDLYIYVLGKPDGVVNEVSATVRQTEIHSGVNAVLETSTYLVRSYVSDYQAGNTDEYFIIKVNCSDTDGCELGGCWVESAETKGIGLVTCGSGGTRIEGFSAVHASADVWLKEMHANKPCNIIILAFDVNDLSAGQHTAAQWETYLSDGIDFHRSAFGVGTEVPVIIWIAHEPVFGSTASEVTYSTEWRQAAGVAKVVANAKTNVVVANTAAGVHQWFDATLNWVPDGLYVGNLTLLASFAATSVVKWTNDPAVTGYDVLGDNNWYYVKTTTSIGDTPGTAAAKFLSLGAAYDPSKTNYERHHGCTLAGRYYVHLGLVASAAGQEPGVHQNWLECPLYGPHERVHPNANGSRLIVEEFMKALRQMMGLVDGYTAGYSAGTLVGGGQRWPT